MANRLCSKLSKGYKQRVGLAQALIHNPDVLILDEPTAGLDPKQINETRDAHQGASPGDHTIILSTHILPEVAQTCQRVVIINKGQSRRGGHARQPDASPEGIVATMYVQVDANGWDASGALERVAGRRARRGIGPPRQPRRLRSESARAAATCGASLPTPSSRAGWGLVELRPDAHEPRGSLPDAHRQSTNSRRRRPRGEQHTCVTSSRSPARS